MFSQVWVLAEGMSWWPMCVWVCAWVCVCLVMCTHAHMPQECVEGGMKDSVKTDVVNPWL